MNNEIMQKYIKRENITDDLKQKSIQEVLNIT